MIDSHAHLTGDALYEEIDVILQRAWEAGLQQIVNINTDQTTLERGLALKNPRVLHTAATTPHDVEAEGESFFPLVADLFHHPGIAISQLLFTRRTGNNDSTVWTCDYDGAGARPLVTQNGYCVTPTSLTGHPHLLSYVSYGKGQPKIFLTSDSEPRPQRLITLPGNQLMPAFSPQADAIAFICDAAGCPDLFYQRFSPETGPIDKPIQLFSAPPSTQGTPTFSPDGTKIAFVSNKDGIPRIYTLSSPPAPRKRPQPLTAHNRESTAPAWSPDGTKIAYCSRTDRIRQIWYHDLATGRDIQVTHGPGNKENPTWGPSSQHLLYNSTDAGDCELYLIHIGTKKSRSPFPDGWRKTLPPLEAQCVK